MPDDALRVVGRLLRAGIHVRGGGSDCGEEVVVLDSVGVEVIDLAVITLGFAWADGAICAFAVGAEGCDAWIGY